MNPLILRSLEKKIPLDMIYLSSKNQITQRQVIVTKVKDSSFYAYCYLRKKPRQFKTEKVLSLLPSKKYFSRVS